MAATRKIWRICVLLAAASAPACGGSGKGASAGATAPAKADEAKKPVVKLETGGADGGSDAAADAGVTTQPAGSGVTTQPAGSGSASGAASAPAAVVAPLYFHPAAAGGDMIDGYFDFNEQGLTGHNPGVKDVYVYTSDPGDPACAATMLHQCTALPPNFGYPNYFVYEGDDGCGGVGKLDGVVPTALGAGKIGYICTKDVPGKTVPLVQIYLIVPNQDRLFYWASTVDPAVISRLKSAGWGGERVVGYAPRQP